MIICATIFLNLCVVCIHLYIYIYSDYLLAHPDHESLVPKPSIATTHMFPLSLEPQTQLSSDQDHKWATCLCFQI